MTASDDLVAQPSRLRTIQLAGETPAPTNCLEPPLRLSKLDKAALDLSLGDEATCVTAHSRMGPSHAEGFHSG